jgi:hypothetical protein
MAKLFEFLKSMGKTGGVLLVVLGLGLFVATALDYLSAPDGYIRAAEAFGLGLGIFGIRRKLG